MKEIFNSIIHMAKHFKLATFINLFGLVASFAAFYFLMTQIVYQVTFNREVEGSDQLYLMECDYVYDELQYCENMSRSFADALQGMPEVESYSLTSDPSVTEFKLSFKKEDQVKKYLFFKANNTALSTLSAQVIDGKIDWADDDFYGLVIPASIAMDYFGTTKAAGKTMLYIYYDETGKTYIDSLNVRGVFEDFPEKSELVNCIYGNLGPSNTLEMNFIYKCIIKFKSFPKDTEAFNTRLKKRIIGDLLEATKQDDIGQEAQFIIRTVNNTSFRYIPLNKTYFDASRISTCDRGYRGELLIMQIACLLVIIIAAINFLNFTLAESPMRIGSLNTRRVLGASRRTLWLGIVAECVVTSLIACLLAIGVWQLYQLAPLPQLPIVGNLAIPGHWQIVVLMIAIAIVVGIIAGVYPATFATSYPPVLALKGSFWLTPHGKKLRTALVCVQLTVSILMAIYIGVLYLQSHYIYHSSYGFEKDRILTTSTLPYNLTDQEIKDLYQELVKIPEVENAAFSTALLGTTDLHSVWRSENNGTDEEVRQSFNAVGPEYMSTMGINIIEGRDFNDTDTLAAIINQAARKRWADLKVGEKIRIASDDSAVVVGVCDNIRFGSTRINNDKPFTFILMPDYFYGFLNLRIANGANPQATMAKVKKLVNKYCGNDQVEVSFYNQTLAKTYEREFRYNMQMVIISIICLLITLIGVLCLTLFETEYRRKEIGIRKVAGATSGEIIRMFTNRYIIMLLISFAVAAPLAYIACRLTLSYFAEHTPIHWWVFPLALLLVGGVILGTVALQCWSTARENPVKSIKSE